MQKKELKVVDPCMVYLSASYPIPKYGFQLKCKSLEELSPCMETIRVGELQLIIGTLIVIAQAFEESQSMQKRFHLQRKIIQYLENPVWQYFTMLDVFNGYRILHALN